MRCSLAIVMFLVACKGDDDSAAKEKPALPKPQTRAEVQPSAALPESFPLPESKTKKLVRSSSRLTMVVWEYEYTDLDAKAAAGRIAGALPAAGYTVTASSLEGDTHHVLATRDGRTYAIATRPYGAATSVAIRSFPESGPSTLPAPSSYPTTFPFLAGGTASHAPDGSQLRIAYESDPKDIELAMVLAARTAGWQCTGSGNVTCTKEKSSVTFTTEPAPKGSLLVVSAK